MNKQEFILEFCNDHNGKVRWLRSVALDEQDLLDSILNHFDYLEGKEAKDDIILAEADDQREDRQLDD